MFDKLTINVCGYRGGVRGIVELCVLKAIEDELHGIPLQRFFDLIVGTR